jgi:capsular exopolysaccharide synthesis family protein
MTPIPELVSLVAPGSMEADQYRGLRHAVERVHRDAGHQVVAITSAGAGDGKTLTTLNLAGALAQSRDARVVVIDADLHRPSVAPYLGIDMAGSPGLVDAIEREAYGLAAVVTRLDGLNLSIVPSGICRGGAYELLSSPRFDSLLAQARRDFDYVLIDTPPLGPLPDSRVIARWVDGFLLVVTAHRTPRRAIADALDLLEPSKVIGFVFNGDDRPLTRYAGYYSYDGPQDDRSKPAVSGRAWWRQALSKVVHTS